jgi:hypothetical protein
MSDHAVRLLTFLLHTSLGSAGRNNIAVPLLRPDGFEAQPSPAYHTACLTESLDLNSLGALANDADQWNGHSSDGLDVCLAVCSKVLEG